MAAQVFPLQRDLLVEKAERLSDQYGELVDGVFPPSDARRSDQKRLHDAVVDLAKQYYRHVPPLNGNRGSRDRLTASRFGEITRGDQNDPSRLVDNLIYPKSGMANMRELTEEGDLLNFAGLSLAAVPGAGFAGLSLAAVPGAGRPEPGAQIEKRVLEWLTQKYKDNYTFDPSKGQKSHSVHKYLSGEPDAIAVSKKDPRENLLVEVKATMNRASMRKFVSSSGTLIETHPYFYQIQGLLQIFGLECCWLMVYIRDETRDLATTIHITVKRNDQKWNGLIFPFLKKFYFQAFLPEKVHPMKQRGGVRRVYCDRFEREVL